MTYWLDILQNVGEQGPPFLVTLDPDHTPGKYLFYVINWPSSSICCSTKSFKQARTNVKSRKVDLELFMFIFVSSALDSMGFMANTVLLGCMWLVLPAWHRFWMYVKALKLRNEAILHRFAPSTYRVSPSPSPLPPF